MPDRKIGARLEKRKEALALESALTQLPQTMVKQITFLLSRAETPEAKVEEAQDTNEDVVSEDGSKVAARTPPPPTTTGMTDHQTIVSWDVAADCTRVASVDAPHRSLYLWHSSLNQDSFMCREEERVEERVKDCQTQEYFQ